MQTATEDLLVGRTLEGRYRILDRIARGGMSAVYSAVDERLDRLVAVKVMNSGLSADPAFTDRFSREARAAARLTHLNTVAVYDQGAEDGPGGHHVFLVMELVRGRTLRDLIRERGRPFSPAEALSIMQPVLAALSAAHAAGIVHRDVKPENILISDDGVVKVADFGLARAVESDASSTRTGLMMGTVAYCPPEQITRGQADQRSDVYSAGIVLSELLTGTPPFQGDSAINVAYQHVNSRVPAPSSRVPGIPSEIDELVVMATDPDPAERPADAAEFLAEVADVRAALRLPIVPLPARPTTGHRGPATRPAAPASATTDVLGARGGGAHDTMIVAGRTAAPDRSWRLHDTDPGRGEPPPPVVRPPSRRKPLTDRQRRRRRGLIALLVVLLLGLGAGVGGWWFASGRYEHVPSVAGSSQAAAEQALRDAGFDLGGIAGSQYSETVPAGHVIATKPGAGSRHVHGTKIALVLSLGPLRIDVPDVRGMTPDQATATIGKQGLSVSPTVETKHSSTIAKGKVINTLPRPGTPIPKDKPVTLYLSSGPPKVEVPTIAKGTPYPDAVQALKDAHFEPVRGPEQYDDDAPQGTVISVSPTGKVTEFSEITITVSKGPPMVAVPDISNGTPVDDAVQTLEDAHLKADVHKVYGGFLGRVVGMDPPSGTEVRVGSTVTLTVV